MHARSFYSLLAVTVLIVHALFILWVVFGAFVTRSRPILRYLYGAASLAMPSDGARELARRQGQSRALPRRVPTSSSR